MCALPMSQAAAHHGALSLWADMLAAGLSPAFLSRVSITFGHAIALYRKLLCSFCDWELLMSAGKFLGGGDDTVAKVSQNAM